MSLTPFTKQQLLPQEEKLEVGRQRSDLFIGIPKETSYQERRICLTPDAVNSLTSHGHRVMIEAGAGLTSSYCDKDYSDAGAEITHDTKKSAGLPYDIKGGTAYVGRDWDDESGNNCNFRYTIKDAEKRVF